MEGTRRPHLVRAAHHRRATPTARSRRAVLAPPGAVKAELDAPMVDLAAYAALQSIQRKPGLDPNFTERYEKSLDRIVVRPPGVTEGAASAGWTTSPTRLAARASVPKSRRTTQAPVSQGLSQKGPWCRLNRRTARATR